MIEVGGDYSELHWDREVLTAAQVATLTQTSGIKLSSGKMGGWYWPVFLEIRKSAGTAFTITGTANIGIGFSNVSGAYFFLNSAGLLDQTTAKQKYRTLAAVTQAGDDTTQYTNQDLVINLNGTGSLSAGGASTVTVLVGYYHVVAAF